MKAEWEEFEAGHTVADYDQQLQKAIDNLRKSPKTFFVFSENEEKGGYDLSIGVGPEGSAYDMLRSLAACLMDIAHMIDDGRL